MSVLKSRRNENRSGHYMDDYYIIVPPHIDAKAILKLVIAKAEAICFTISRSKTKSNLLASRFSIVKPSTR